MLRHLKRLSLAAAVVPLLMLASADAADSQPNNRANSEPGVQSDQDVQYVAFQRRGRHRGNRGRYWGNYWNWHNNTYRPYWNRRYRTYYGRNFNNRYTYYPGYYGRGYNRFNNGSTFGLRLGNFGIRYRDWDWD